MRNLIAVLGCLAVCAIVGCGKPGKLEGLVPVSGTVTYNNAPLEGASVTFAPAGQTPGPGAKEIRSASGITDKDGKFTLTTMNPGDGAFPGDYNVLITKIETTQTMKYEDFYSKAGSSKDMYTKGGKATKPKMSETKVLLPAKFGDPKTSNLKATVKVGDKEPKNFDLK